MRIFSTIIFEHVRRSIYQMFLELKENIPHGTKEYPYDQYNIHNIRHPFQFPVHWHEELEIIYIREGKLHVCIEGEDYWGNAGSIFLVNPKELHLMDSDDFSVAYYTLLFPVEFISFQTTDDLENHLLQPLRSGQLQISHEISDPMLSEKLYRILEEITLLNQNHNSIQCQIQTRILLLQFLCLLVEHDCLHTPAIPVKQANIQRDLLTYIREHYTEKISLRDLSEQFHLSEKYISRYFKEHFQITFSSYTNHLRLTYALRLLETTELPITEVALRSGFPNVSYFIRVFKNRYGVSPHKYQNHRLKHQRPG